MELGLQGLVRKCEINQARVLTLSEVLSTGSFWYQVLNWELGAHQSQIKRADDWLSLSLDRAGEVHCNENYSRSQVGS